MDTTTVKVRPLLWGGFWKPVRALVGLFRFTGKKAMRLFKEALWRGSEALAEVIQFLEEKLTFNLFTIRGVRVRLHWSLLLLVLLLVGVNLYREDLVVAMLVVIMLPIAFGSILLHELGHVMVARFYGVPTQSISLHMLGSTSLFKDPILKPYQEFVISIAGPLVNVLLGGVAYGILYSVVGPDLAKLEQYPWLFPIGLMYVFNLIMLVLNLLPVYPMDGSKILRSLLEMLGISNLYATYIVGGISVLVLILALGITVSVVIPLPFTSKLLPILVAYAVAWAGAFFMVREFRHAKILNQDITPYTLSVKEYLSDVESEVALRALEPIPNTDIIAQLNIREDLREKLETLLELNRLVYTMAKLSKSMRLLLGSSEGFLDDYPETLEDRVARYYDEAVQAASEQTESESRENIGNYVAKRVLAEELSLLLYGHPAAPDVRLIEEPLQEAEVIQEKCIKQTATVRSTYLKMQERNLDYLVVLDEENRIVGVIKRRKLAEELLAA